MTKLERAEQEAARLSKEKSKLLVEQGKLQQEAEVTFKQYLLLFLFFFFQLIYNYFTNILWIECFLTSVSKVPS